MVPTPRRVAAIGTSWALLAMASLLLYAAVAKAQAPGEFERALRGQGVLGAVFVPIAAWLVPAVELAVGVAVMWCVAVVKRPRLAAGLLAGIALVFATYAWVVVVRHPQSSAPCGCGLRPQAATSWPLLVRTNWIAFGMLSALAYFAPSPVPRRSQGSHGKIPRTS